MTTQQAEIRLRDLDGLGEIRVTVWRSGDVPTFRFELYDDGEDDEPSATIDVSSDDAMRLAMGIIAGTVDQAAERKATP